MMNKEIASTLKGMISDWNAATPAQRTRASRLAAIAAGEKELDMRERAVVYLSGVPAQQNLTAIARLYDELNRLHIEEIEARS